MSNKHIRFKNCFVFLFYLILGLRWLTGNVDMHELLLMMAHLTDDVLKYM